MINVAIFASGSGTNAEKIIQHFQDNIQIQICLVLSNKADAGVHARAKKYGIKSLTYSRNDFNRSEVLLHTLKEHKIDFVVLAGFLLLIPEFLIQEYPNKIVNIHPALLPKFGGKGMYGSNVHKAVLAAKEKESGISIHLVNEHYDEGKIIFQSKFELAENETLESLEEKIHAEEYKHYPSVIEKTINLIIS